MKLFKKIIILVNLIFCMLCINVFATITTVDFDALNQEKTYNIHYEIDFSQFSEILEEYPYFVVAKNPPACYYIYFSKEIIPVSFLKLSNSSGYYYTKSLVYDGCLRFTIPLVSSTEDIVYSYIPNNYYETTSSDYTNYLHTHLEKVDINGNFISSYTSQYIIKSNFDIVDSDGKVYFENNETPSFDDSTVDWESAFDFYVGSLDRENIEGKSYEYSGHYYADKLYLFWTLHSLDNTISVTATEQYGFWYYLESELEFIFTDSKGEKHSEIISTINLFDDSIFAFELPYLVQDSSLEKEEQYDSFLMALEFYLGPFTGNYENWEAWFYECVECYVDSYGYFDYEIVLHSNVYKTYWSDVTKKELIYTYADIPITYDMNSSSYIKASDGPSIFYPDKSDKDFYYIIGPDGEIIGVVDNSDNYDVDDDNYTVDKDGNTIGRPEVDENGKANFVDKDGNVIESIPIGPELPTPDEIIDNIEVIGDYDLSRIFTGLKNELEELLEGNSLFNKFANMFQQIINWLPFSIKSLFFILISFYLIFEFIHILRK